MYGKIIPISFARSWVLFHGLVRNDLDLARIDFDPDNMEAISLGPRLPNGHYTLIVASDNNFNPKYQRNVFAAFEIVPNK